MTSHEIIEKISKDYKESNVEKIRYVVRTTAKALGFEVRRGRNGANFSDSETKQIFDSISQRYIKGVGNEN